MSFHPGDRILINGRRYRVWRVDLRSQVIWAYDSWRDVVARPFTFQGLR